MNASRIRPSIAHLVLTACALTLACTGGADHDQVAPRAAEAPAVAEQAQEDKDKGEAVAEAEAGDHDGCVYKDDHAHKEHGCDHGREPPADAATGHFGAPFTLAAATPLAETLKEKPPEGPVQVRGEIDSVCQKMGCWMVVRDGQATARILFKDHGFTVPTGSKGKPVVVEGTLATRTFSEKQVKHLEEDAGGDPKEIAGERQEFVLTATGVEIRGSQS